MNNEYQDEPISFSEAVREVFCDPDQAYQDEVVTPFLDRQIVEELSNYERMD